VRAISNLVDITNWIMLEYGQPMHVFDADKVEGDMIIRSAKKGEKLVALDGETYELSPEDTVVADSKKALSVAGIMGGLESSVTEKTTSVIFEVANWDPVAIRKTSQRLGLRSESSMRYEKSLDPEQCRKALLAAVEKAMECCSAAKIMSNLVDEYPAPGETITVILTLAKIQKLSGLDINQEEVTKILQHLGFTLNVKEESITVQVPSWRSTKDVSIAEDIIEEVVRLYGLDKVPTELPSFVVNPPRKNELRTLQWKMRAQLASLGYLETYLHSFVPTGAHLDDDQVYIAIANPLSEECRMLRRDLWPQMMAKLESELRTHRQVQCFELGKVYHAEKGRVLPTETERLLIMWASLETKENDDFFMVKADLLTLLQQLGINDYVLTPAKDVPSAFHPAKTLACEVAGRVIGHVGVLHPRFLPVKKSSIVIAEIDINTLVPAQGAVAHQSISSFPMINRDISLVVSDKAFSGELINTAIDSATLLQDITLFDEYQDVEKIGVGLKNLAFHLTFQAPDRTLTEEEIELELKQILDALDKGHKATLRNV